MADHDQYYIDKAKICEENGQIPAELYTEYDVKKGLRDKNGVKIFEGDIVEHDFGNYHIGNRVAVVEYSQKYCGFQLCPKDNWAYCEMDDCVVIGNVHDNPELLED